MSYNIVFHSENTGMLTEGFSEMEIEEIDQLESPQKTVAVYHLDSKLGPYTSLQHHYFGSEYVEEQENGWLYTYRNGRQVLSLREKPTDDTVDVSKYIYIAVIKLSHEDGDNGENLMRNELNNRWVSTFLAVIDAKLIIRDDEEFIEMDKGFLHLFVPMAQVDRRVKIVGNPEDDTMDSWFFRYASIDCNINNE